MRPQRIGHQLRVLSYNIHGLHDDRAALAAAVRDLAPDVTLVQEAPRRLRWRHRAAALAQSLGQVVAGGGAPAMGNLILVDLRVTVKDSWSIRFPLTPGRHLRGAAFARCLVAGVPFLAVATHLGTDPVERPGHARLLAEALAEREEPAVVGADLNDEPGGPAWQALADGLVDTAGVAGDPPPATFPAADPQRRIDAIFADRRFSIVSHQVVDTPAVRRASDHLPVVVDLHL